MGNKFRLPNEKIYRIENFEKKAGIEDMNLFAYIRGDGDLVVNGEIYGKKLNYDIKIFCSVYDAEGDIIASSENNSYTLGGCCSSCISAFSFKGILPFSIEVEIPEGNKIDKIRIYVQKL